MFQKALPVFLKGKQNELNMFASFQTKTASLSGVRIRIAAHYFYRLFVNDSFVSFGPARSAKGYARVDELDLSPYGKDGENKIEIIVAGYNCRSLSTVKEPSFLQAELRKGDEVIAATGFDFDAYPDHRVIQIAERYSKQRHFTEVRDYRKSQSGKGEIEILPQPVLLERHVRFPDYVLLDFYEYASYGNFHFDASLPYSNAFYSGDLYSQPEWGMFPIDEIPNHTHSFIQRQRQIKTSGAGTLPFTLHKGQYVILDLKKVETGFLRFLISADSESELAIGFSEISSGDSFSYTGMHVHNALHYFISSGEISIESFEPYAMRYIILMVKDGAVTLQKFGVRTFAHTLKDISIPDFNGDEILQSVYRGAVNTFAHNAVDLYTDCPSRERAGWLCDSYFTAKVEDALFHESLVEDNFLENYIRFPGDSLLPKGMLPMCYPSDIPDNGKFIPQWSMWYILEVADYLKNRRHAFQKEGFIPSVNGLLAFYAQYEREDGLLAHLPSWNFVEWSKANDWTQDVNYPTNFLYAKVLEVSAELLEKKELSEKAARIRKEAIRQSFNGRFFRDHGVYQEDGSFTVYEEASEACQYYAILFADIDIYDSQYNFIREQILYNFGAKRKEAVPEIAEINAFIGAYLRLEALLKMGEKGLVVRDIKEFFGEMEKKTGTLWEYRESGKGSQDHGFASYAAVALLKALD